MIIQQGVCYSYSCSCISSRNPGDVIRRRRSDVLAVAKYCRHVLVVDHVLRGEGRLCSGGGGARRMVGSTARALYSK
jgi:hypothetical protein